jgi:geranylgeranyl pyrophosphate synthase
MDEFVEPIKRFARDLGIAFQILNDLADWQGDNHNKLSRAQDLIGGRPTVLWALALQDLSAAGRQELERLVADDSLAKDFRVRRAAQLYAEAHVCDKAHRLIDKHEQRAKETIAQVELEPLRDVLTYLVDHVLARHGAVEQSLKFVQSATLAQALPVASP